MSKVEDDLAEAFEGQFMQPEIYEGDYWEVETDAGTEIVPTDVASDEDELPDFIEGSEVLSAELKHGWLARIQAPGYLDSSPWSAFDTYDEAAEHLVEMYGDVE